MVGGEDGERRGIPCMGWRFVGGLFVFGVVWFGFLWFYLGVRLVDWLGGLLSLIHI